MSTLLSREQFREQVLLRDRRRCLSCQRTDRDLSAHHILNRHLWADGGYYLENGASLCDLPGNGYDRLSGASSCHKRAEDGQLSPQDLWRQLGIEIPLLPDYLVGVELIDLDCWGNYQDLDRQWQPGPLFEEEQVQKKLLLSGRRWLFS